MEKITEEAPRNIKHKVLETYNCVYRDFKTPKNQLWNRRST